MKLHPRIFGNPRDPRSEFKEFKLNRATPFRFEISLEAHARSTQVRNGRNVAGRISRAANNALLAGKGFRGTRWSRHRFPRPEFDGSALARGTFDRDRSQFYARFSLESRLSPPRRSGPWEKMLIVAGAVRVELFRGLAARFRPRQLGNRSADVFPGNFSRNFPLSAVPQRAPPSPQLAGALSSWKARREGYELFDLDPRNF